MTSRLNYSELSKKIARVLQSGKQEADTRPASVDYRQRNHKLKNRN
jgi:hypothetical protein